MPVPILVFLDVQHRGKPSPHHGDTGAGSGGYADREVGFTGRLALGLHAAFYDGGAAVCPISDGHYSDRHSRAVAYAAIWRSGLLVTERAAARVVYLALHANAGGGQYALLGHDHRSARGLSLAADVRRAMVQAAIPEPPAGKQADVRVVAGKPGTTWEHVYNTIDGVYAGLPTALCLEPVFLDQPAHDRYRDGAGLDALVKSVVAGVRHAG